MSVVVCDRSMRNIQACAEICRREPHDLVARLQTASGQAHAGKRTAAQQGGSSLLAVAAQRSAGQSAARAAAQPTMASVRNDIGSVFFVVAFQFSVINKLAFFRELARAVTVA